MSEPPAVAITSPPPTITLAEPCIWEGSRTGTVAVMFSWDRQTSLKLPAAGKVTLKVWPLPEGGAEMQVEPSKVAGLVENPGHPTKNGSRT